MVLYFYPQNENRYLINEMKYLCNKQEMKSFDHPLNLNIYVDLLRTFVIVLIGMYMSDINVVIMGSDYSSF